VFTDRANKEIILSTGSLDTPRILMHSGLGPASHLAEFNLPVLVDLPAIGQGLRDHPFSPITFLRDPSTNTRNAFFGSQEAMDAALAQWEKDNSGPWTRHGSQLMMGFLKSEATAASNEYKALPEDVKRFLSKPTIPHYELLAGCPLHMLAPGMTMDYSYVTILVFLMNAQSYGQVRLQSSDPDVPLLFDPNLLAHEYDRRVVIEALRAALDVTKHEAFAKDTLSTLMGPASESDEDLLEWFKNTCVTAWHMTGTVKMGKVGDPDAAVDTGFRVFGVEGLRVADMSVVPVLTNNHTQATAYVVGATAAEVLIKEYGL
jgi:choline dehydrogenase-like flavoprotein